MVAPQRGAAAAKTQEDYRWRLEKHLLSYFGAMTVDAITFDTAEGCSRRPSSARTSGSPVVMAEMGHTSPALALTVYAQAMRRGEDEQAALRPLVEGSEMADTAEARESSVAG